MIEEFKKEFVCECVPVTRVQGWPASHGEFSVRLTLFGMLQAASFLMSQRWMSTGVNVPSLPWVPFHLSNSLSLPFYLYQAGTEFTHCLCDYYISLPLWFFLFHSLRPFVLSGFSPVHLSSK